MLQRFRRLFGVPRDRVWEGESNIRGKSVDRYASVEIAGRWVWGRTRMQLAHKFRDRRALTSFEEGSETAFLGKIWDAHRFDIITIFVGLDFSDAW